MPHKSRSALGPRLKCTCRQHTLLRSTFPASDLAKLNSTSLSPGYQAARISEAVCACLLFARGFRQARVSPASLALFSSFSRRGTTH
jgi:hypothetical protein